MSKFNLKSRHIRWNMRPNSVENLNNWYFVIVDALREIELRKSKIREVLAPTNAEIVVTDGLIRGSGGQHYEAIRINSYQLETLERINFSGMYFGKWIRDRNLGSHKAIDGLQIYVDNLFR